jgi:hypothetical protein
MAHSVSDDGARAGGDGPDGGIVRRVDMRGVDMSSGDMRRGIVRALGRGTGDPGATGDLRFRLWIASYSDWLPTSWNQVPPRATAVEPVDQSLCSAEEAALFLQGFNGSMLAHHEPIWAVAVPITLCYEGDAVAGFPVQGYFFPWDEPASSPLTSRG